MAFNNVGTVQGRDKKAHSSIKGNKNDEHGKK